ncbi:MAG: response regulator, partial [Candidatus Kapaibacterium sp.]
STSPTEALALIRAQRSRIDIVITDIEMPVMTGFQLCSALKDEGELPYVGYLTYRMNEETRFKALRTKVDGLIYKSASIPELADFLRRIMSGPRPVVENIPEELVPIQETTPLTSAERKVLYYIACECLTTRETAELLHRSEETVMTHRKNIMEKLCIRNIAGLVRYALHIGLQNNPPA